MINHEPHVYWIIDPASPQNEESPGIVPLFTFDTQFHALFSVSMPNGVPSALNHKKLILAVNTKVKHMRSF